MKNMVLVWWTCGMVAMTVLPVSADLIRVETRRGQVAFEASNSVAEFKDITVSSSEGTLLWSGLPDPTNCVHKRAQWQIGGDVLRQGNAKCHLSMLAFGDKSWGDYVFRCKVRKLSGYHGFALLVRVRDDGQRICARFGDGDGRVRRLVVSGCYDYGASDLKLCKPSVSGTLGRGVEVPLEKTGDPIEIKRWYEVEVSCRGDVINVKLDGESVFGGVRIPGLAVCPDLPNEIRVDLENVRFPTAPDLWGIFVEDINFSLDGGLYAEMVRNRSFEEGTAEQSAPPENWEPVGNAECVIDRSRPLSEKNARAVRIMARPSSGIANCGYYGMNVRKGVDYRLSVALRGSTDGPVDVSLEAYGKPPLAIGEIGRVGSEWQTHKLVLKAVGGDSQARLAFRLRNGGTLYMDCVSLFPSDAVAGIFRRDLVDCLAALKPSFMRFPGGCWVEGEKMEEAYRWKRTVGSVWERPASWNLWEHWSSNGIGHHEYFLLAEALGAKPLYCINAGISHSDSIPLEKMDEFVQDALDCIEYANGDVNTTWGRKRAEAGHPQPFGLDYMEIGNENSGRTYEERYALFAKEVRKRYPNMKLVFNGSPATQKVDAPNDLRDDHFYREPSDFMGFLTHEYDSRKGDFDIFVGEYAANEDRRNGEFIGPYGPHRYGSLLASIGEAAFMLGLERNQNQVKMASFAPLFVHSRHMSWSPNLIYLTTEGYFTHPSWIVQRLFSENRGCAVLPVEVKTGKSVRGIQVVDNVQASAVRDADGSLIVKIVNCTDRQQVFKANFAGRGTKIVFTGANGEAHNSISAPNTLMDRKAEIDFNGTDTLPPLSLVIYRLRK